MVQCASATSVDIITRVNGWKIQTNILLINAVIVGWAAGYTTDIHQIKKHHPDTFFDEGKHVYTDYSLFSSLLIPSGDILCDKCGQYPGTEANSPRHHRSIPQALIIPGGRLFVTKLKDLSRRLLNGSWLRLQIGIKGRRTYHCTLFLFHDITSTIYIFGPTRIIGFGDCYLGWIEAHRIYFVRNCVKMCFQFAL